MTADRAKPKSLPNHVLASSRACRGTEPRRTPDAVVRQAQPTRLVLTGKTLGRRLHRLAVDHQRAARGPSASRSVAVLDLAGQDLLGQRVLHRASGSRASGAARRRSGRSPRRRARCGPRRRARASACGRPAASAAGRAGCRRSPPCCSRFRRWNRMISSMRFRNSGRNLVRISAITYGAHGLDVLAFLLVGEELRADVAGHDDQRVLEVDRAALAVGQAAVVEHLQQHVEHVAGAPSRSRRTARPGRAGGARLR